MCGVVVLVKHRISNHVFYVNRCKNKVWFKLICLPAICYIIPHDLPYFIGIHLLPYKRCV